MKINSLLDSIQTHLNAQFPDLKTCESHDGRFDAKELMKTTTRAPAMHVSVLGIPKVEDHATDQTDTTLTLVIYVLTKDTSSISKGDAARNMVEALTALISKSRWGVEGTSKAENISGQNLYNSALKNGIALWAVTWQQTILLGDDIWNENGVMPTELYAAIEGDESYVSVTNTAPTDQDAEAEPTDPIEDSGSEQEPINNGR